MYDIADTHYVYVPKPISEEDRKKSQDSLKKFREESDAKKEKMKKLKRPLLETMGLSDIDSALDCYCSCHPSPGDISLHDNGLTCSCQLSKEERKAKMDELLSMLEESREEFNNYYDKLQENAQARAKSLNITLEQIGGMAPFTIDLIVDGRRVYVRSRHELYSIRIATKESPLDEISYDAKHIVVEEGDEHALLGRNPALPEDSVDYDLYANALEYVVNTVRVFLLQEKCVHGTQVSTNFCPICGKQLRAL